MQPWNLLGTMLAELLGPWEATALDVKPSNLLRLGTHLLESFPPKKQLELKSWKVFFSIEINVTMHGQSLPPKLTKLEARCIALTHEAHCTDIIKRAARILDYDLRDQCSGGARNVQVCKVLRALYHVPEYKSVPLLCQHYGGNYTRQIWREIMIRNLHHPHVKHTKS